MFAKKNLLIVFVCSLIAMLFSLLVFVIVVSKLGYLSFKDVKEPNLSKDIKSPKTQEQRDNKTNQLAQRVAEQVKEQFQLTTLTESQIKEIKDGKIVLSKEQLEAIKGELKPFVDLNFLTEENKSNILTIDAKERFNRINKDIHLFFSSLENKKIVKEHSVKEKENFIVELIIMYLQLIYPAQIKINKEAMNCGGKVDIKVDFDDFVYIAECKMFDKVLNKEMENIDHACDQLMNYTNGQNKEGAIFLFNKNSNFAGQIKTIEKWIKDKHKLEPNNCKGPNPNSWVVPIKHLNGHDFTLYIACYNLSSFVAESKKHEKQKDAGIKTVSSHKEGNIQSNEGIQENLTTNKQGE